MDADDLAKAALGAIDDWLDEKIVGLAGGRVSPLLVCYLYSLSEKIRNRPPHTK